MERTENRTLPYGRKFRVGNYTVMKYGRVIGKDALRSLRTSVGIPERVRKELTRASLPYIRVEAVSGIWAVEYCCNTAMYRLLDTELPRLAGEGDLALVPFAHMFSMIMTDACSIGDDKYLEDKAKALKELMERVKAPEDDGGEALRSVEEDEEAKATIIRMSDELKKGGGDEDGRENH